MFNKSINKRAIFNLAADITTPNITVTFCFLSSTGDRKETHSITRHSNMRHRAIEDLWAMCKDKIKTSDYDGHVVEGSELVLEFVR